MECSRFRVTFRWIICFLAAIGLLKEKLIQGG